MKLRRYYCLLHLKFYGSLCFLIGTIIFIPLFITALCYDVLERDVLISFLTAYVPCMAVFLMISVWNIRFLCMIRRQERLFGVTFSDKHAVPLWRDAISFLSDDWFIHAGSAAFYKDYISSITWEREIPGQGRGGYYLNIETTDNRNYHLFIRSRGGCEKVKKWWKEKATLSEVPYGL